MCIRLVGDIGDYIVWVLVRGCQLEFRVVSQTPGRI